MAKIETPAKTAPATSAKTPCRCAAFSVAGVGTGCTGTLTFKNFAPGHDAKLKGLLIKAGDAKVTGPNGDQTALEVAAGFGFAHLVAAGHELAKTKAAAKAARPAKVAKAKGKTSEVTEWLEAKVTAPVAKKAKDKNLLTAKVGRDFFEGVIEGVEFVYTDKAGKVQRTVKHVIL